MRIQPIPSQRADVAELLHVERRSLGDSDLSVDEALAVLQLPPHLCLGAYVGEALVGFLFCFETYAVAGPRLELDMLGVLPERRNRGVATALIRAAIERARASSAALARAVVRTDNAASLAAFLKAGLSVAGEAALLIWERPTPGLASPALASASLGSETLGCGMLRAPGKPYLNARRAWLVRAGGAVASAIALQVNTLAYRGCWIEELAGACAEDRAALATLLGNASLQQGLHEAGMLALTNDVATHSAMLAQGWQEAGTFYVLSWSA
jgi:GNAT superfamily N-acetyltransferase